MAHSRPPRHGRSRRRTGSSPSPRPRTLPRTTSRPRSRRSRRRPRTRRLPPSPPARSSTCRENHNPRPRTRCGRRPGRAPPRTSASRLGLPVSRRPGSPAAACLCHFVGTGQPCRTAATPSRGLEARSQALLVSRRSGSQSERLVEKGHSRTTCVGISVTLDTSQALSGSLKELAS